MNVLILTRYGRLGASSRLRVYQYVPYLEADGIHCTVQALLDDDYVQALYGERVSLSLVAKSYYRRLRILLHSSNFDVIYIQKELFNWIPALVEAVATAVRPIIFDIDDAVFHRYDRHRSAIVRHVLGGKHDALMRRAALVTAGNAYLASRAVAVGAPRVEVVPTVVDAGRYPATLAPEKRSPVTVGWIGSPNTAGYLHMLAAPAATLAARGVRFVAIGARPDQVAGTPFEAQPWSEATEVDALCAIDIGVMPLPDSPWERGKCGYKLIQYMAAGRPVVASPVGVNTSIVADGESGFLAANEAEWIDRLERLVADGALRRRMGIAGRSRVEEEYSVQVHAPRLAALIRSVV